MSPAPRMAASPRSESLEFDVEAVRPFRLELAVWVLRRRPENLVDRWDGETYRRALIVDGTAVDVAVRQVGDAQEPRLRVNVQDIGSSSSERVRSVTTRFVQHALGISIDLGDFKRFVRAHPDLREALAHRPSTSHDMRSSPSFHAPIVHHETSLLRFWAGSLAWHRVTESSTCPTTAVRVSPACLARSAFLALLREVSRRRVPAVAMRDG
jgi:hypothetical protein